MVSCSRNAAHKADGLANAMPRCAATRAISHIPRGYFTASAAVGNQ